MNFASIQAKLSGLREKINQDPLSANASELLDISVYNSDIELKSILDYTRGCFTISSKLINKDYKSTDPAKNKGYMYNKEGTPQETSGLLCILDRIENGLLELLCKLPYDNEFDDLHQELLEKHIQTVTLISYLSSLKFGG
jgi:hypothetical protein